MYSPQRPGMRRKGMAAAARWMASTWRSNQSFTARLVAHQRARQHHAQHQQPPLLPRMGTPRPPRRRRTPHRREPQVIAACSSLTGRHPRRAGHAGILRDNQERQLSLTPTIGEAGAMLMPAGVPSPHRPHRTPWSSAAASAGWRRSGVQARGYRVTVLERLMRPGGRAYVHRQRRLHLRRRSHHRHGALVRGVVGAGRPAERPTTSTCGRSTRSTASAFRRRPLRLQRRPARMRAEVHRIQLRRTICLATNSFMARPTAAANWLRNMATRPSTAWATCSSAHRRSCACAAGAACIRWWPGTSHPKLRHGDEPAVAAHRRQPLPVTCIYSLINAPRKALGRALAMAAPARWCGLAACWSTWRPAAWRRQ